MDVQSLLTSPCCGGTLNIDHSGYTCAICGLSFPLEGGIPRMLVSDNRDPRTGQVTDKIRSFYEETPFPDYEHLEDTASLINKARGGMLARLLDEQLPHGIQVLEAGCGTGQLSNFLSVANRDVFGADLSMASLTLAEEFRRRNALNRARFVQMNLFQPCFANETFHAIISNGVLHHTGNPAGGIARLAQLLKPGGYLIIGLYHRFGRLATDARRTIFRLTGERMRFLDRRAVSRDLGDKRQEAWFNDQYRNPHESKHTISEAATFFEKAGLKVLRSLPSRSWSPDPGDNLFEEEPISGRATFAKEITFALRPSQIAEGGFFVLVGQRQ